MKALEVLLDGEFFCLCVPPEGGGFAATIGNVPKTYMRAFVVASNDFENRRWQLPDIVEGRLLAFRMIDVKDGTIGREPSEITARDPKEVARTKAKAERLYKRAMSEKKDRESGAS